MTADDNAWNRRNVDYSKIHGESPEAYIPLIDAIKLKAGMRIGDIMSGYGAVSKEILKHCSERAIDHVAHHVTPITMILTDGFRPQLSRSVSKLAPYARIQQIHRVVADTRALPFTHCLDAAVIKHGLHELPQRDHVRALKNIHTALNPGGSIFVWEMMGGTPGLTAIARDILRAKDMIAGYESLVQNRYFAHDTEIRTALTEAGFTDARDIYVGPFYYETKKFLESDLQSDPTKLEVLNHHIRAHTSDDEKSALHYIDSGESIRLTFLKKIIQATA